MQESTCDNPSRQSALVAERSLASLIWFFSAFLALF